MFKITLIGVSNIVPAWHTYIVVLQIFIQGHQNLNRAVHSDVVAIEMLAEDDWSCPSSLVLEATSDKVVEDSLEDEVC